MQKFLLVVAVLGFQAVAAETLLTTETRLMALKSNEQLRPDIKALYAKDFPDIDKLEIEFIEPDVVVVAVNHLVSKTVIKRSYSITYENQKVKCRDNLNGDLVDGAECAFLVPISIWVPLVPKEAPLPRWKPKPTDTYRT